uniref:Uncharacterized protein n=1 Tax=Opuntia streptacantha TaxID=393608 RepID=A0A7C9D1B5_OPUST
MSPIPQHVDITVMAIDWCSSRQFSDIYALIGPNKPCEAPKRNLVTIAIQKFTLKPKRVLKMTTANVPTIITGLRPYLSAMIPQATDVSALPSIKADPTRPP